ncbi:hypothetical protein HHI36_012188 [Cryptolaemus montrouzieri]|uniref:Uncharacterized protein n=1 Tax=Cryptolaemus montrouzieri TaxID=559131 RepID=A0ABD2NE95_9CUCU
MIADKCKIISDKEEVINLLNLQPKQDLPNMNNINVLSADKKQTSVVKKCVNDNNNQNCELNTETLLLTTNEDGKEIYAQDNPEKSELGRKTV